MDELYPILVHCRTMVYLNKLLESLQPIIEPRNLHPSRQLSGFLGDVILDFGWLPTTFGENRQQSKKIDLSSTMY